MQSHGKMQLTSSYQCTYSVLKGATNRNPTLREILIVSNLEFADIVFKIKQASVKCLP